jgi:hypothetical protein
LGTTDLNNRHGIRREDNIKMDLNVGPEDVDWIQLAQNRV